ncbi:MAG: MBL fold metallo-hydrolase [Methanoregula sp.]
MGKSDRIPKRIPYTKPGWGTLPDGQEQLVDPPKKSMSEIDTSDISNEEKIQDMIATYHPDEIGFVFLDAGQGDATIIRLPNGKIMVVDCNVDNAPENIIQYLKDAGIERIDYLVVTHPHHDHMSGLKDVADNFEVVEVWTTQYHRKKSEESEENYQKYKEEYLDGIKTLKRKGAIVRTPTASNDPIVDDGKVEIKSLGPSLYVQGNNEDIHEESLAIQIRHQGKNIAFFPGDTTDHGLDRIRSNFDINDTRILHASHHGSDQGANEEAIKAMHPELTIIPVGKNNPHGHPHDDAMNTYRKNTRRRVYRTDHGNVGVRLNSNGDILDIQK